MFLYEPVQRNHKLRYTSGEDIVFAGQRTRESATDGACWAVCPKESHDRHRPGNDDLLGRLPT